MRAFRLYLAPVVSLKRVCKMPTCTTCPVTADLHGYPQKQPLLALLHRYKACLAQCNVYVPQSSYHEAYEHQEQLSLVRHHYGVYWVIRGLQSCCWIQYPYSMNTIKQTCILIQIACRMNSSGEISLATSLETDDVCCFGLQSPSELMMLDACMARFAMLLQKWKDGCVYAKSAVSQMEMICPRSPEHRHMQSIMKLCLMNMEGSKLV